MSEQWFLDLDGVRSGPYQTSEVMSLVAEGEILPHHQIATELKSQKWTTILEWRLNQNRMIETKLETPKVITPEIKKVEPPIEKIEVVAIAEKIEIPAPIPIPTPTPPSDPKKPKRDPMAEMFDMLQNTKQKREVKSQQTAQAQAKAQNHAHVHTHKPHTNTATHQNATTSIAADTPTKSSWGKTILVGMMITIIGFALGQFFQHKKSTEPSVATNVAKSTPAPTATPAAPTETITAQKETTTNKASTVDRSTDKITIRAQVSPTPEQAKEMQDLRDLKKELLELKALKEEIHNTNNPEHSGTAPNMNNYEPETAPIEEPNEENANPENATGKDIHY